MTTASRAVSKPDRHEIKDAKRDGFKPGASYARDDGVVMVEITPGNFVNEAAAKRMGVKKTGERV